MLLASSAVTVMLKAVPAVGVQPRRALRGSRGRATAKETLSVRIDDTRAADAGYHGKIPARELGVDEIEQFVMHDRAAECPAGIIIDELR